MGIAPMHSGFADHCLTAWLPGRTSFSIFPSADVALKIFHALPLRFLIETRDIRAYAKAYTLLLTSPSQHYD